MGLTALIEKLIREHGSASISKEHVELLREEARTQDRRYTQEVNGLKETQAKEIARLNEHHAEEIAALERAMAAIQKQDIPAEPQLGEGEVSVIRILACSGGKAVTDEMVGRLGISETKLQYLLDNLKALGLAKSHGAIMGRGSCWNLTAEGRAYAVKNGLDQGGPPPSSGFFRAYFRSAN